MCVAFHLAHKALYTAFLHLIAHFEISPAEGKTDDEINPLGGLNAMDAFIGAPRGWKAKLVPRKGADLGAWLERPDEGN